MYTDIEVAVLKICIYNLLMQSSSLDMVLRLSINAQSQSSYRKFIILICNVVQEYLCHSCYNFDISSNELSRNVIMSRSAEYHEV